MNYKEQENYYKKLKHSSEFEYTALQNQSDLYVSQPLPEDAPTDKFLRLRDIVWVMIYNAEKVEAECIPCVFNENLTKIKDLISGEIYPISKSPEEINAMKQDYTTKFYEEKMKERPYRRKINNLLAIIENHKKENKAVTLQNASMKANSLVRKDLIRDCIVEQYEKTNGKVEKIDIAQYHLVPNYIDIVPGNLKRYDLKRKAYYSTSIYDDCGYYINLDEIADISREFGAYATFKYKYDYANKKLNELEPKLEEICEGKAKNLE